MEELSGSKSIAVVRMRPQSLGTTRNGKSSGDWEFGFGGYREV